MEQKYEKNNSKARQLNNITAENIQNNVKLSNYKIINQVIV